ncbi:hypothetical protein V6N11_075775 [Hibiscus sabdariffa]|uniref:RNase H type-1 domain-containing protein n=1 Tax=Hibiscus sabdariffa TaxID=183260 RepID=A0ABR2Q498_9ROSI
MHYVLGGNSLVNSISRLLSVDWVVVVKHISHGTNRVADLLTKRNCSIRMEPSKWHLVSTGIENLILEEKREAFAAVAMPLVPVLPVVPIRIG